MLFTNARAVLFLDYATGAQVINRVVHDCESRLCDYKYHLLNTTNASIKSPTFLPVKK